MGVQKGKTPAGTVRQYDSQGSHPQSIVSKPASY